eukprot:scaffold923_cov256-Pinguiococcus_pyrenoidosus.AAC.6
MALWSAKSRLADPSSEVGINRDRTLVARFVDGLVLRARAGLCESGCGANEYAAARVSELSEYRRCLGCKGRDGKAEVRAPSAYSAFSSVKTRVSSAESPSPELRSSPGIGSSEARLRLEGVGAVYIGLRASPRCLISVAEMGRPRGRSLFGLDCGTLWRWLPPPLWAAFSSGTCGVLSGNSSLALQSSSSVSELRVMFFPCREGFLLPVAPVGLSKLPGMLAAPRLVSDELPSDRTSSTLASPSRSALALPFSAPLPFVGSPIVAAPSADLRTLASDVNHSRMCALLPSLSCK